MGRRGLFWPSLFWLVLFLLLLTLGTWQIERLHWKEGLIAQRQSGMSGPPIALPATLAAAKNREFDHVRLDGTYRNRDELYLHAISDDGKPGFHVFTPFALAGGGTIFVNRGFVPEDRRDPATRATGQLGGPVTVTGLLRLQPTQRSYFTPANEPGKNLWFSVDLSAMAAAAHIADPKPFYVDADATAIPGGYPLGGQTNAKLPNDHLQYALTWYGLAALVPIYYVLFVRGILRDRKTKTRPR